MKESDVLEFSSGSVTMYGEGNLWTASTTVKIGNRNANEKAFTLSVHGFSRSLALRSLRDQLYTVWEVARLLSENQGNLDYQDTTKIYRLADQISAYNIKQLKLAHNIGD
jgi:hypothetical protein